MSAYDPEMRRFYAKVANFPKKLDNLRNKIAALRDEAEELSFRDEAHHLAALATFADCLPMQERKRVDWSPEEVAQLKRLWLEGLTSAEIGRRIGKTDAAVRLAARRHKLPARRRRAAERRAA